MIKGIVTVVLVAIAISTTHVSLAQTKDIDREVALEKRQQQMHATIERLNLSDEQAPKVKAILREGAKERRKILSGFGFGEGERPDLKLRQKRDLRKQLQAVSKGTTTKLRDVLSDGQLAEYKKIQEEQRIAMRERIMK